MLLTARSPYPAFLLRAQARIEHNKQRERLKAIMQTMGTSAGENDMQGLPSQPSSPCSHRVGLKPERVSSSGTAR